MVGGSAVAASKRQPYAIRVHPDAVKAYGRISEPTRSRVNAAIDSLALEPRPEGMVRLAGRDDFRIRVGDYRIVYAIDDEERLVLIGRIAHRREVYRR